MNFDRNGIQLEIGDYVTHGPYSGDSDDDLSWGKVVGFDSHYVLVKNGISTIHKYYWNVTKINERDLTLLLLKRKIAV